MHIAICDDNIADRKHLERLLGRESDKRAAKSGVFYINAFGNADTLLDAPLQYDLFFIDMPNEPNLVHSIVDALITQGVTAPIILCSSTLDYSKLSFPNQVLFLCKPIIPAQLDNVLDHAIIIKENAPSLIELRVDEETLYVPCNQILYAVSEGQYVNVTLAERTISILSTMENFYYNVSCFTELYSVNKNLLINVTNISDFDGLFICMKNGKRFLISPATFLKLKSMHKFILSQ